MVIVLVVVLVLVLDVAFIFEDEEDDENEDEQVVWNFRTRSEKHPVEPSYSLLTRVARASQA